MKTLALQKLHLLCATLQALTSKMLFQQSGLLRWHFPHPLTIYLSKQKVNICSTSFQITIGG